MSRLLKQGLLQGKIIESAKAATACPAAANPAPAAADTSRCQPREAALFNPRTRSNPLSLAARQHRGGGGAVLRRCGGAGSLLLRAPSVDRAWPGQRLEAIGAIVPPCRLTRNNSTNC